jgi:hypothetical protein
MADNFESTLGRLLDQYDEKRQAVAARVAQVKAEKLAFIEDFAQLRRAVIRPVFEVLGGALRARGHAFTITEEESTEEGAKATEAKISINIMPVGPEGFPTLPEQGATLSFVTRHYTRSVEIRGGNIASQSDGAVGRRGDYQLSQITPALVQEKLLSLVGDIVKK